MPKRALLGWVLWACSLIGCCFAAAAYVLWPPAQATLYGGPTVVFFLLGAGAMASSVEFLSSRVSHYRVAAATRAALLLVLLACVAGMRRIEFVLLGAVTVEVGFYEPYPRNLVIGGSLVLAAAAVRVVVFVIGFGWTVLFALLEQSDMLIVSALLLVPACLFTRYREQIISVSREKKQLDGMVVELAKANLQYQEYATGAAEAGMREERLRITRDIHDVVGYTLTNNIAMMEAATDMMRRNPLGVPALIKAARDNARDGLQQIRVALYRLRAQSSDSPRGLRALTRLCHLFERATRIEVRLAYGNARSEYGDAVDSALYHLVQEALLNAFRHGKAARAAVILWEADGVLAASISDDGVGAGSVQEGIGLRGMRERIESLGGQLRVTPLPHGFAVRAELPVQGGA